MTSSFSSAGFAWPFGEPHHLADEERRDRLLAGDILRDLLRIRRDDFIDHRLDRAGVGDLLRLVALVDLGEVLAFGEARVQKLLQHLAGELA